VAAAGATAATAGTKDLFHNAPIDDWPAPWELTAPESHVLIYNGDAYGVEPVKLAVKELIARQVLRAEIVTRGRLRKDAPALYEGARPNGSVAPALAPMLSAFNAARRRAPGNGVFLSDLRAAARAEVGRLERYHEEHVVPLLVGRGLLIYGSARGFSTRPTCRCTAAGRDAESELQRWIALGRENLARWRADEPAHAVAYLQGAGAALLLAEDLYPEISELHRNDSFHNVLHHDPVTLGLLADAFDDRPGSDVCDLDFATVDLSTLGALGNLAALDAPFGGGGDGGGDGGGG